MVAKPSVYNVKKTCKIMRKKQKKMKKMEQKVYNVKPGPTSYQSQAGREDLACVWVRLPCRESRAGLEVWLCDDRNDHSFE